MLLRADNICKTYFRKTGDSNYFYAVSPTSLELSEGTVTVLTGRSGSGKTTLLNMLSGILEPTEGTVRLGDTDLYSLKDAALSRLDSLAGSLPKELSGGELRRMAIIRAMAAEPDLLFADEPTGDLDDENTDRVLSVLHDFAHREHKAVFIVTHENDAVKYADRVFRMEKGRLSPA